MLLSYSQKIDFKGCDAAPISYQIYEKKIREKVNELTRFSIHNQKLKFQSRERSIKFVREECLKAFSFSHLKCYYAF